MKYLKTYKLFEKIELIFSKKFIGPDFRIFFTLIFDI